MQMEHKQIGTRIFVKLKNVSFVFFAYSEKMCVKNCVTVATMSPCMFLASALMRGIHPLKIFKMADVQGGECLL